MINYLQFIFLALAAICNAIMDRVENVSAYNKSVFKSLPQQFWLKEVSWKYAMKILGYKVDSWHFAKSLMIVFIIAAIVFYKPVFSSGIQIVIFGTLWNLTFNLFYNVIFFRK